MTLPVRRLGSTGAEISELALGTFTFGLDIDAATSRSILATYLAAGGNFIDTADTYDQAEEILGPLLKGIRDEVLIASKVGRPTGTGANEVGTSRVRILRQIERTLRRLDTDWIDVYYCHVWDPATPLEETLSTLDGLVRSGKVRYIGVSNFLGWQIAMAHGLSQARGWEPVSLVTAEYSLVERGVEREIQSLCLASGLPIMPWSPLGGGMLSGKYGNGVQPEAGTRAASTHSGMVRRRLDDARNHALAKVVREIAQRIGRSPAQVALNWVAHRPAVVAPVVGVRTVAQLTDNLAAVGWRLDSADSAALDAASAIDLGYPAEWNHRYGIRRDSPPSPLERPHRVN